MKMSGCSTSASASAEVQDPDHLDALPDNANLSKISEHSPLQHENEVGEEDNQENGNENEYVPEEEDEDEDADFNPALKDTNSLEASSSLSSGVEDLDMDVADSRGEHCAAFANKSKEKTVDIMKDCHASGNIENGEEGVMHNTVSDLAYAIVTNDETALITQSENGSLFDKENALTSLMDVSNATDSWKPTDMDTEDAICMRTRARYSLVSRTLDELETFLQETDDEDDLQIVDDEEEYKKFLAAVLRGDHSQNLQSNANADDEDEENDADFELELEEALESEPEEIEERRITRRNRFRKASFERSKKLSEPLNRPLRPLVPFASIGTFPSFDGKHFTPSISPSYVPTVNNGYSYGFTPHQIGQLHCLIHEHVQLLIQVFSLCVLEPGKSHIASEVKELAVQMHNKRNQVLAWRTVPYPNFCFFPPYICPSVSDGPQKIFLSKCSDKNVLLNFPSGSNRALHCDSNSMSNTRHNYLPDEQGGHSKTPECTSWVPYVCGPVLSVMDVAPLKLVENYIDDVSLAVRAYEQYQIKLGFETPSQKEPLFPLRNTPCSVASDGQGETGNTPADSSEMLSPSSNNQISKKTMAATLLEKAKNQSVALVPKEIAKLAQRFWPLFNPALYPHKPPPAPIANRVLFTDAEDELLALGLMEYNTDWKAIQQRFLPCKSRHQIFVRQKNRASSKASENPIKAVRRIKNSPLTSEEIARIEVGLKKFKLDWISIWRFFVPYRDPSLLPRQWRIASGTQKSYKSDANKKAKRRLYELRRKSTKPSPSIWHSSSEKEGDSSDNAVEETNSGDNCMDKDDEAYLHEAFLAGWAPENNVSSSFPAGLPFGEGPQAREQKDNSVYGDIQPPFLSKPSAASRLSSSQVVPRPYRARRPNAARLVKLAPDLPPVNLPPSVRVMSQSAFKSSQAVTSAMILGNAPRIASVVVENRDLHARSTMNSGVGSSMKSGPSRNNSVNNTASNQHRNHAEATIDKCIVERGDSDFQMHPLLLQTPQDGDLRYYPSNSSASSSFTFCPGKQPQLSLSLFHNPRHIRDAVNFLSKSSKTPEKNASTLGVDFHPLLHNDVDADSIAAHRLPSNSESKRKSASIRNPSASTSTPSADGISGTKITSHCGQVNKLDLNIRLSFTSKNQEAAESRNMTLHSAGRSPSATTSRVLESKSVKDSSKQRDSAPDAMSGELDSGDIPLVTSRNKVSRKVSDNMQEESLPQIIMEQEELSDSEEEFGANVEFECEEMADSERDSMSDSELVVDTPNEELPLEETDADIDDGRVVSSPTEPNNTCSTSDRQSIGLALADKGIDIKPDASFLNLNSCTPASPYPKGVAAAYEFGPFGAIGTIGENQVLVDSKGSSRHIKSGTCDMQKHDDAPRKRVCRSNSSSSVAVSGKGNSSSDMETSVVDLKNVL